MARRKSKNRMPPEVVEVVKERSQGACEAMIPGVCHGRGEQLHHRKLRSQGGEHTVQNLIDVCGPCHLRFHREVAEAHMHGWIVKSTYEPADVLVVYRGNLVELNHSGHIAYKPDIPDYLSNV